MKTLVLNILCFVLSIPVCLSQSDALAKVDDPKELSLNLSLQEELSIKANKVNSFEVIKEDLLQDPDDFEAQIDIRVFPNPTVDKVYLTNTRDIVKIVVFDMSLRKVLLPQDFDIIDMSSLPADTYQFVIETRSGMESMQVVKK